MTKEFALGDAMPGDKRAFTLYCNGPCKNVDAVLEVAQGLYDSGDAGLFAQEDGFPNVKVVRQPANVHNSELQFIRHYD